MTKFKYRNLTFYFTEVGSDTVVKTIKSGRFYEQEMLQYLEKFDFDNSTIVDVGAHIGNHSIYFATFTNCDKVLAIEPNPRTYSILAKNIKNNKLENRIETFNLALGDKAGKVSIQEGPDGKLGSSRVIEGNEIKVRTLDAILKNNGVVSLIKIDVEGYEVNVLRGAKDILKKQSPLLAVEAQTWKAKRSLDKILHPLGYRAVRVFNRTDTYIYVKDRYPYPPLNWLLADVFLSLERLIRIIRRNKYFEKLISFKPIRKLISVIKPR
ncbi:MAG: FkbM family methyltransferase [Parcubacteria group bacterium]